MRQCIVIPVDLMKRLERACSDRYQKKSQIIQMALKAFLDSQQQSNPCPGGWDNVTRTA
jgi:metal-responsive CopG/Arc/MetJ family transcriptional regulator